MFNAKFSNTCYHSKSLEWQPSLIALKPRHILQLDMPTMANLHFIDRDENKGQTHYITLYSNEWITTNFESHCLPLKLHINLNEKLTFKSIKNNQSLIMSHLHDTIFSNIFGLIRSYRRRRLQLRWIATIKRLLVSDYKLDSDNVIKYILT